MFVRYLFLVGLIFFILSLAILAALFFLPQPSSAAILLTPRPPPGAGGGPPCGCLAEEGIENLHITKYWPTQMDLNTSDTIRVLLIPNNFNDYLSALATTAGSGTHRVASEQLASIPGGFFESGETIAGLFGSDSEPFATAHLAATTFDVQPTGPGERPLDLLHIVEWSWIISPKILGRQVINVDIDIVWKSKKSGQVIHQVQLWQSNFDIKVTQPFFDSSQLTAGALGSALLGLSSIFAAIIAWGLAQISKRSDERREGKTKEAGQNSDGTGERPPPPAASPSNLSPSTSDSQTTAVTHAPIDRRGSPSTSAVSPATQLDELSQRANAYYMDLQVYSREHTPAEWAATQNNLGATLVAQARLVEGPERQTLFTQAVTAYRSALEVHTPEGTPTQWAIEQSNLGNALSALAQLAKGSEQRDLLTQAATAYHAALHIYTPEQTSAQWARAQMHLARVQLMMASLENDVESRCAMLQEASQSPEDILSFFSQEGDSVFSQQAIQLYRTIQEQIQASGCRFAAESEG